MTGVPEHLLPLLGVLRGGYPHGVPDRDYLPLLEVLQFSLSERSLAALVAALTGRDPAAVADDSAKQSAGTGKGPGIGKTGRVKDRLERHGWDDVIADAVRRETYARISPLPTDTPGYMLDSLAVLRRAYPDGIPAADYRPLLAALRRDASLRGLAELVGAYTGRHYMTVYNEVGGVSDIAREDADRVWQRLLDNGWIPETPSDDDWPDYALPSCTAGVRSKMCVRSTP